MSNKKSVDSAPAKKKNSAKRKKSSIANSPRGTSSNKNPKRTHKSSKSENVKKKRSINEFTPIDSIESLQSTNSAAPPGPDRERSASRKKKVTSKSPSPRPQQHSRYSTANAAPANKKRKNRPKNKIKAKNKAQHNKAATTHNALQQQQFDTGNHRQQATQPNPLQHQQHQHQHAQQQRVSPHGHRSSYASSALRHKFNVTEMQLVIGQIADMKKSWKTPAEKVMVRIYQIIEMAERPHLNGKYCKVMLVLDDENYRVVLLNNSSEHVVTKHNLSVAFETENLYLLWESQQKSKKSMSARKRSTFGRSKKESLAATSNGDDDHLHHTLNMEAGAKPAPPQGRPPHMHDADDMLTIKAFETSFNDTYEFKRYDFYCMALCIALGVVLSGVGVYFYVANDMQQNPTLYAFGAFSIIFAPILALMLGVYIGCIWYCCAVKRGQMDYYLGENRFFGLRCQRCDCCKFQYFVVVSLIGLLIVTVTVAAYMLFDKYVIQNSNEINTLPNTNALDINLYNEQNAFLAIEILACIGGIGLFVSGISMYCCCRARVKKMRKASGSAHHDDFNDNDTIANFEE
eukprot:CAMPEP_0202692710 /NCGR_PEP_ID=MMETSP1385-20130828/7023_1 /ASSEMBLY_ACC=CAM_ASM_000861 /TAXON_ID=933848 /ORGANISM="Elphidium margaritaceum" /LENGTH=572 /DNA_ID=CAMNT_0049348291 /DNA_START=18 /DNA_END=1736 /DNA_ORIENTATION=-